MNLNISYTDLVAFSGLALGLFNLARDILKSRCNISASPVAVLSMGDYYYLKIAFINNSSLPVTITRLRISVDGRDFEIGQTSIVYFTYSNPSAAGKSNERSTSVPISLDPLGFKSAVFLLRKEDFSYPHNPVDLIISTNRRQLTSVIRFPEPIKDEILTYLKY